MANSGIQHVVSAVPVKQTTFVSEEFHALIHGTSFPASPVEKQLFYRDDLHAWYIYNGTSWVSLQAAAIDELDDIGDVEIPSPSDGDFIYRDSATGKWKNLAHKDATTGVHGVGTGTIGSVSTANKTIRVDKAATGAADGTSWTDAFTTIMAAVDSMEDVITHAYTITVRKGATPYRETVYLNSDPANYPSHLILGSLTIEGEYYWYGDCEANVGGAGEITDTGAFADVLVGDKVLLVDLNGANSRAQDYEFCTVDNIDNIPNRIGTDGTKTPAANWKYAISRTEISGSDDGTDGGTARDYCIYGISMNNVTFYGFYLTFSDSYAIRTENCRNWNFYSCFLDNTDNGVYCVNKGQCWFDYYYINVPSTEGILSYDQSHVLTRWGVMKVGWATAKYNATIVTNRTVFDGCVRAVVSQRFAMVETYLCTILNTCTTGAYAEDNSAIALVTTTNSATTPEHPVGTTEGAYISTVV